MLIRFLLWLTLLLCMLAAHFAYEIKHGVPEAVAKLVDDDMVLSAMRNAKFECEKNIPNTQECILVYDYVAVRK